ncbi:MULTISPECIES: protein kinase domain-containing protein [unclassified Ensifer]|uniref:protein kinase domain-containing protein n=1 Tax=unclassified Ensifer TaxID=2633371 RepID=UPI0007142190|nr:MULTISPECIES: protein kinase [unclassified Ensifer]KQX55439.1 hypothetical protein ASD49_25120 [Ensifer sp. Root1298]KQX90931.1 hypothetical protein ASD41_23810 [Ensifer sp. Root1312]KRC25775.1 hypothetical protein ASE29_22270 [Ensifer sp. Root74]KRD73655.1 hypothetical protein ASE71_19595 [Ensifer sp. Root954]
MVDRFAYPDDHKESVLEDLQGAELPGGWKVTQRLSRKSFQSGSCFSVGYIAEKGNERAFMKAFDFWDALKKDDPIAALNELTQTYLFERELLEMCGAAKMTKVVRAISNGTVADARAPLGSIFYLLFELADGDVRTQLVEQKRDFAWRMRSLHHIGVALQQLHQRGIYHQDLKPSNVLVFTDESKLGDLGRAHCVNKAAPHDAAQIPGAFRYAPPELLYGSPMSDALAQKRSNDLYLFGSMMCFFVSGMPVTPFLLTKLDQQYRPFISHGGWRGFYRDALPFLIVSYEDVISDVRDVLTDELPKSDGTNRIITDFIQLLRYATNPDPQLRGHPANRRMAYGNSLGLERFVSSVDLIATRVSILSKSHA